MFESLAEAIRSRRARRTFAREPHATPALHRRRDMGLDADDTADVVARPPARSRDRAREFVERLRNVPEAERDVVAATLGELAEAGTARTGGPRNPPLPPCKRRLPTG